MSRKAEIKRKTGETDIALTLELDGKGEASVDTGIGFFDHMLNTFARHGFFDLTCTCRGDLEVDCHHTIEDVGIAFGTAIKEALGDKAGIRRFGQWLLPMDESLVLGAVDLSGRGCLGFDVRFTIDRVGAFDTEMAEEFFYAVAMNAGMNLHLKQMAGTNNHHIMEACFKAFAKSLDMAAQSEPRLCGVLSTKGSL